MINRAPFNDRSDYVENAWGEKQLLGFKLGFVTPNLDLLRQACLVWVPIYEYQRSQHSDLKESWFFVMGAS